MSSNLLCSTVENPSMAEQVFFYTNLYDGVVRKKGKTLSLNKFIHRVAP